MLFRSLGGKKVFHIPKCAKLHALHTFVSMFKLTNACGGCYSSRTKKKAIFDPNSLSLTHFLKANLKEISEWLLWGHYLTFLFQHYHYQMNSKNFPIIKVGKSLHSILEHVSADFAHDNSCCPPLPVGRSSVSEV